MEDAMVKAVVGCVLEGAKREDEMRYGIGQEGKNAKHSLPPLSVFSLGVRGKNFTLFMRAPPKTTTVQTINPTISA